MQSDIPPLPISCLHDNTSRQRHRHNITRTSQNAIIKNTSSSSKSCSNSSLPQSSDKCSHPSLVSSPYRTSFRGFAYETQKNARKSVVGQRINSAKMLQIKQLQNKLADAQFHIHELINENKVLKVIQKRQDLALKRYEGTNAELPKIINSHQEELRILQTKFKKLKLEHKQTIDSLKEKERELQSLQAKNKKLVQLGKSKQLGEREKLQNQVADLNHRVAQQDETIQNLKRKLSLETKYLNHQLNAEIIKNKELNKKFDDAKIKIKSLEDLLEQQVRRSYNPNHQSLHRSVASISSRSLTNLSDSKQSTSRKSYKKDPANHDNLPKINGFDSSKTEYYYDHHERSDSTSRSERSIQFETLTQLDRSPVTDKKVFGDFSRRFEAESLEKAHRSSPLDFGNEGDHKTEISGNRNDINHSREPLIKSSGSDEFEDEQCTSAEYSSEFENDIAKAADLTNKSRLLHARLIGSNVGENDFHKSRSPTTAVKMFERINGYDDESIITVVSRTALNDEEFDRLTSSSSLTDIENEEHPNGSIETSGEKRIIHNENSVTRGLKTSANLESALSKKYEDFVRNTISEDADIKSKVSEILKSSGNTKITETPGKLFHDKKAIKDNQDSLFRHNNGHLNLPNAHDESATRVKMEKIKNDTNINSRKISNNHDQYQEDKQDNATNAFDKDKLLAAMRAIDDNENFELMQEKSRKNSGTLRSQITENLYRGLPSHAKKKNDIMKELFNDNNLKC